ncbi:MAG: isoprenyl transferase [Erysipelotrichaceae bacterium]
MVTNSLEHIAIIMDGNGRWAQARGLKRTAGHKAGSENIRTVAIAADKLGIKQLTLYAFSTENWNRPKAEIEYLTKLPKLFFKSYLKEMVKNNLRVETIGDLSVFPKDAQESIQQAKDATKHNTGLVLCFAINYGSQREIVMAAQQFAKDALNEPSLIDALDESGFEKYLMTHGMPPIDLMIRTSGEQRLSNYLLWQLAYAEFVFTPVAWPDFHEEELKACIEEYHARHRRFGGL